MPVKPDETGPIEGGVKFKSIGNATELHETLKDPTKAIGIKTPLEFGVGIDGVFKMHRTLVDQIKDNFRNLLLTNHGEHLGKFDYGANLRPLLYQQSDDVSDEMVNRIRIAVQKWMPYISLETLEVAEEDYAGKSFAQVLRVAITYSLPELTPADQRLSILLV
jgi:phage baseplate assembly protein W